MSYLTQQQTLDKQNVVIENVETKLSKRGKLSIRNILNKDGVQSP